MEKAERRRRRESDSGRFPLAACKSSPDSAECKELFKNLKNPYYIGDQPGLTQTLGWVDAWATQPSVYAIAARNAQDIAAGVNFARENNLRLVVKGGGHSYQGTSNAPDSLLIWTRHMHDITMHDGFVPQGCGRSTPQRAVTLGSGAIWMQAYDAVTTKAGGYVQGGGCTTVGVAGLIQSGGFGSFSKHYGTAAAGLLEAEVVTADGEIRIANACTNPDLFWALKGGGGGSFGVVSKVTLRVRELPEWAGGAIFNVKASSDDAYRRLIRQFVGFYREALFNDHWGEQAHFTPDNTLVLSMVSHGLDTEQAKKVWQPFMDWLGKSPGSYTIVSIADHRQHAGTALVGRRLAQRASSRCLQDRYALRRLRQQCVVDRETAGRWDGSSTATSLCGSRILIEGRLAGQAGQRLVCRFPSRRSRSCISTRASQERRRSHRGCERYGDES